LPTRAFILIETEVGRAKQVAEALRSVPEVLAVDVITGNFDVIATIEAPNMSAMAEVVTGQVQSVRGVIRTITCVSAG
jgi:DNA-binding Lrp family transcriptional regulator